MPYSNIVFIKLFLSLFEEDDRFLYQLNESQQLLYIKMLYMAASSNNKIPKNYRFVSHKINYSHEESCLVADIDRIKSVFPKFIEEEDCYKFNNFHELHNFINKRKSKGTPKELQRIIPEKRRVREEKSIRKKEQKIKHLDCVFLLQAEYDALCVKYGNISERIETLNNYKMSTGKKYKSDYHTIIAWARKDELSTLSKTVSRGSVHIIPERFKKEIK